MKLRRIELQEDGTQSVAAERSDSQWIALAPLSGEPWARDVVAFLAGGTDVRAQATALIAGADPVPFVERPLIPFAPRSFRAFSIYPQHLEQSARNLAKRFFPAAAGAAIGSFEKVTRRTFPALKPKAAFFETPAFYMGNHTAFLADGETLTWPSHSKALDYELELGFVLAGSVSDATPEEGEAAIGGFFIVNDWSARDVQAEEYRHGIFGPVVKSKTFNNSMGPIVVTADELLSRAGSLRGSVRVNGEVWSETSTEGAAHSLGALVAYASAGERLAAGDAFATGTLPNGCGMELDRWIEPGDVVQLELEELGTLTNTVGPRA